MSYKITESSFDRNYQKLLKGVSYLLFKNADNVRFIGSSRFKGVKAKEEKGIMLIRMAKELARNRPIDAYTPLPFKSNRKIKNQNEKKEIEKMKNSVVALRRLEYVNFLKNKKKYSTKKITFIQQYWRQYFYCYYLPCVMRIQRNIRLFIQRKNKKREFGISSSQLELYYQMRNKTSTGVQANIKREKNVVTINALYNKNVLTLLTKGNTNKHHGLRCLPGIKLKKEIDQRANRKHFISSYNTMETSLNSTFTIINHIDKPSINESFMKKPSKDIFNQSSTYLFTNDTTIRSLRREMSSISRLLLKRKKICRPVFYTKKYYTKKTIDDVDMKIRTIQRSVKERYDYVEIDKRDEVRLSRVIYNNDDKLIRWISRIATQSTRIVYMGELERQSKKMRIRNRMKIKAKMIFFSKVNLTMNLLKTAIKEHRVKTLIKKKNKYHNEDDDKEMNNKLMKIIITQFNNKILFASKSYSFDIMSKIYRDQLKEEKLRKEMEGELDDSIDTVKDNNNVIYENLKSLEDNNLSYISKDNISMMLSDQSKRSLSQRASGFTNEHSMSKLKGDKGKKEIFIDDDDDDVHNRSIEMKKFLKSKKKNDQCKRINIKLIKKDKKEKKNFLNAYDIDSILMKKAKSKERTINQILLSTYINYLHLDSEAKRRNISNEENRKVLKSKRNKKKEFESSNEEESIIKDISINEKNALEDLYRDIYSIRNDNTLYMLKRRYKSKQQNRTNFLLRDETSDKLI